MLAESVAISRGIINKTYPRLSILVLLDKNLSWLPTPRTHTLVEWFSCKLVTANQFTTTAIQNFVVKLASNCYCSLFPLIWFLKVSEDIIQ